MVEQNCMTEWTLESAVDHADPFNEVELDVVVTEPDGVERTIPAFWNGGREWKVRYSSAVTGEHRWRSVCSDAGDAGLHAKEGRLEVTPYTGDNPLLARGPLRVSENRRFLEHADGTPFFWLADTWWMGLCSRLRWPDDFRTLVDDRVSKGFSVVQFVAGPYPDMDAFDERGVNEAGQPWEGTNTGDDRVYDRINPAYYEMADRRVALLVEKGLVPCFLGCWGYYLLWTGVEKMKRHWRYLVARYGAYPSVWCMAGEGTMPYYLARSDEAREAQRKGWTEVACYVREIDPYARPLTIHPTDNARNQVEEPSLLDFDMLQTGHGDRRSLPNTIRRMSEAYAREPTMPVLNGEVCYEGIGEECRQEVQRHMFWLCILSGACGHTYGANGLWQVNRKGEPYGPSPHGRSWGNVPWDDAMGLPGSEQLGIAKRFLLDYEWWAFEPHPEWVESASTPDTPRGACAGGIPGKVRMFYLPSGVWGVTMRDLEPGATYRAFLHNPVDGSRLDLDPALADESGSWKQPGVEPVLQDWVVVIERRNNNQ